MATIEYFKSKNKDEMALAFLLKDAEESRDGIYNYLKSNGLLSDLAANLKKDEVQAEIKKLGFAGDINEYANGEAVEDYLFTDSPFVSEYINVENYPHIETDNRHDTFVAKLSDGYLSVNYKSDEEPDVVARGTLSKYKADIENAYRVNPDLVDSLYSIEDLLEEVNLGYLFEEVCDEEECLYEMSYVSE